MKRIIAFCLTLFAITAFAQTPDTLTPEKNARWKIGRIRDNTVRAITPADFRNAFNAVANMAARRIPYLTAKEVRDGKADTAQVIQVMRTGRVLTYKYDAASTDADDSVTVIRNGSRRYKLVTDIYTPQIFDAVGDGVTDDTEAIKKLIRYCASKNYLVTIPKGIYKITSPITIDSTIIKNQNGLTIRGQGSYRDVQFVYSGTGYCLNVLGAGDEGGAPITRFTISNIYITGNNNTVSDGGFNFKRCYITRVIDCGSVSWAKANAHAISIRNAFNFRVEGGNYSNGFPDAAGGSVAVVGSENPSAWNSSNIQFVNSAIQRGAGYGIEVVHDANLLDNLLVDNCTLGGNKGGSFYCNNPNVNNITITNCHFESAGKNGTTTPDDVYHVFVGQSTVVVIDNNEFKDAKTHVRLDRINAFRINPNKFFESGAYTIAASTGISITGTSTAYSIGSIDHQSIFSNQIDTPISTDQYSRVTFPNDVVTETQWNAKYSANPAIYKNATITRSEVKAGNPDQAFQSKWVSDGTTWYRLQLNERGVGWAATMPTTGSYTQGDMVLNRNPTLSGVAGFRYVVAGWERITTGSTHVLGTDWVEKREYYELSLYTANASYDPPSIAAGAEITTTVTVTGATVGQVALASFRIGTADGLGTDIEIHARVTADNTVTVFFKNKSAAPVDLASGSINARVF